jgi:hypothetical protein
LCKRIAATVLSIPPLIATSTFPFLLIFQWPVKSWLSTKVIKNYYLHSLRKLKYTI